jgi:hypothetical protein
MEATVAVTLPPKPVLHGVIVDEARSIAFLEDASTRRILGYRVGDTVAGGQLERIIGDRVVIRRADGEVDVLLSDPAKHPAGTQGPAVATGPTPPARRPPGPASAQPRVRAPRVLPDQQPPGTSEDQ